MEDIRRMKEEGIITNNDVLRSEMQLTDDRLSVTETENNIRIVSQQLDILLGLDEHLLLIPDTTLLSRVCQTATYHDYINRAVQSDPSMQLLRKQTELAQNNIQLTRAEQLPDLSLTASNTLAMDAERANAGMASALLGALGFAFGGVVSPVVGLGDCMLSTGIAFLVGSVCSFLCTRAALHRTFSLARHYSNK